MTPCPAWISISPPAYSTRSLPRRTIVNSSNSGVWPGSIQPPGLRMCATLRTGVPVLTRPTYSSINLGLFPAASTRVGVAILVGTLSFLQAYVIRGRLSKSDLPESSTHRYTDNFAETFYDGER